MMVLASFVFQIRMLEEFGWTIEFVLVSLLVAAFWSSRKQYVFLVVISGLMLNWRPGFSKETIVLFAICFLALLIRERFLWRRGFVVFLTVFLGTAAINIIPPGWEIVVGQSVLWKDMFGSLAYAILVYEIAKSLLEPLVAKERFSIYATPR